MLISVWRNIIFPAYEQGGYIQNVSSIGAFYPSGYSFFQRVPTIRWILLIHSPISRCVNLLLSAKFKTHLEEVNQWIRVRLVEAAPTLLWVVPLPLVPLGIALAYPVVKDKYFSEAAVKGVSALVLMGVKLLLFLCFARPAFASWSRGEDQLA